MKIGIFSIHDSAANAYMNPFFFPTIGLAMRAFADLANDETSSICKHSADYTLFHHGELDNEHASFNLFLTPKPLAKAIEVKTYNPEALSNGN